MSELQNSVIKPRGRVLYVGQAFYNAWYLSRALRKLGWKADLLNWDPNVNAQKFYHGEDYRFRYDNQEWVAEQLDFYFRALTEYDIFHFSNAHGIHFSTALANIGKEYFGISGLDVKVLKKLGKKIVYSNNGCLDGVSPSSFRTWEGAEHVCDNCKWLNTDVCNDELNLVWGKFRNELADYQVTLGGNRKDYNDDPRVHEVPEFYCLDSEFWNPNLTIPPEYQVPIPADTFKIYHAVGNYDARTEAGTQRNIKSTHVYVPLIQQLKDEGYNVELIFCKDIPNKVVRYYQAQADVVVDMLTFGFFGANIREAMMLGKPAVCYLRPQWLESMKAEIPDYVAELPVISATPDTIREVLIDLIENPEKRREIGRRSREFALKWHSPEAGARRFDKIYSELLSKESG